MSRVERRNMWPQRVAENCTSGQSVAARCRENDLPDHQMRYWLRRLRDGEDDQQGAHSWIEVGWSDTTDSAVAARASSVLIHIGKAAIEVGPGFDAAVLPDVVGCCQRHANRGRRRGSGLSGLRQHRSARRPCPTGVGWVPWESFVAENGDSQLAIDTRPIRFGILRLPQPFTVTSG
ncbi:MAG: IS66 family insertion sequence element accessory protein TnpA [Limnochordia bacterium]